MADDTTTSFAQERQSAGRQGGRPGAGREQGGREPGGFRIRLSDNEMRAARAVQEAFGLRSTVAALGFALRTTAQMLEEGKLEALVSQQRSTAGRGDGPRQGGRREGRPEGRQERAPRIDPFARPSRPAPAQPVAEAASEGEFEPSGELATDDIPAIDPTVASADDEAPVTLDESAPAAD
ncbi:MAG: hypothetical protein FJ077_08575 [Cyanobacteria bacterium K_DeepCast_35m_m2_023]|nr:hypothetical protein [Cyanobacteria bacterium K_DeepCast_35m_m2_023]